MLTHPIPCRFPSVDKRKVAVIGHEIGAIAGLHKGLCLQAARLQARDSGQGPNAMAIHKSSHCADTAASTGSGSEEAPPTETGASRHDGGTEEAAEDGSGRGCSSELRVGSVVMLDPSILPGLDQPPEPRLMPGAGDA